MRIVFNRLIIYLWLSFTLIIMLILLSTAQTAQYDTLSLWTQQSGQIDQYLYDIDQGLLIHTQQMSLEAILSEDGTTLLKTKTQDNGLQLIIFDNQTGREKILGTYPQLDASASRITWGADDQYLVAITYTVNQAVVYRIDLITGQLEQMTKLNNRGSGIFFSPDRQFLVLRDLMNVKPNGNLIDLQTGQVHPLGYTWHFAWSPDSRYLANIEVHPASFYRTIGLSIYDVQTQQQITLDQELLGGLPVSTQRLLWSGDSKSIIFASFHPVSRRNIGLYQYHLEDGTVRQLHSDSLIPINLSPDAQQLLVYTTVDEQQFEMHILDMTTLTLSAPLLQTELIIAVQSSWSDDSRFLVIDHLPSGFKANRHLTVYDSQREMMIFERDFALQSFFPVLERNDPQVKTTWRQR